MGHDVNVLTHALSPSVPKKRHFLPLETLHAGTRAGSSVWSALSSHTQPRTQAQEADSFGGGEVVERVEQDLQMSGEMLLVLLEDREELLKLLVVDSFDVARGLVEVSGQACGVVGKQGTGACDL